MKTKNFLLIVLVLQSMLWLAGCDSPLKVGELQTESYTVELGNTTAVRVEIVMGAGDLDVSGGSEDLLEADFTYNVERFKPEVQYMDETLLVQQPNIKGASDWWEFVNYRNSWNLSLNDEVPMDLHMDIGGGSGNLQLAGLSLTALDIDFGAGEFTIDLDKNWTNDLHVIINAGAADVRLRLPTDVGVRVEVEEGARLVQFTGLTKDENAYINAAYGVSDVTLQIEMTVGFGQIYLEAGN